MTGMAKYINREALVEWLKRIPLKDLSDGRGLCRVIFEDDFKRAIKKIPKGIIYDPREGGEGTGGDEMSRLWNWCAFCGKPIETGEKCYGLPNGESVCADCCVAENEGAEVSDGEQEQEGCIP